MPGLAASEQSSERNGSDAWKDDGTTGRNQSYVALNKRVRRKKSRGQDSILAAVRITLHSVTLDSALQHSNFPCLSIFLIASFVTVF